MINEQNTDKSLIEAAAKILAESKVEKVSSSADTEYSLEDFTLDEIVSFMISEEYEALDELSKALLGHYIIRNKFDTKEKENKKADLKDTQDKLRDADHVSSTKMDQETYHHFKTGVSKARAHIDKESSKVDKKLKNRQTGLFRAVKKLTKESVE